ncbi:MAG: YqaJ viral recombinase family protein [Planctomycetota bacterium]
MTITKQQRLARKGYLGSSDVAAVFGLHPFLTEKDLWAEKTMDLEDDEKTSEAIEIGNDFERPLLGWASKQAGLHLVLREEPALSSFRGRLLQPAYEKGIFNVHPDAMIVGGRKHMEAKTTGNTDDWGDTSIAEPSGEVPLHVQIQVNAQMYAAETEAVYVPVLLPGFNSLERRLYLVRRNQKLVDVIVDTCGEWWETHVVGGKEPEGKELVSHKILKRIKREAGKWHGISNKMYTAYMEANEVYKEAEKKRDFARDTIIVDLGDAEGARSEGEAKEFTYFTRDGRVTFGRSGDYQNCKCSECGVGQKVGKDYRQWGERKRSD